MNRYRTVLLSAAVAPLWLVAACSGSPQTDQTLTQQATTTSAQPSTPTSRMTAPTSTEAPPVVTATTQPPAQAAPTTSAVTSPPTTAPEPQQAQDALDLGLALRRLPVPGLDDTSAQLELIAVDFNRLAAVLGSTRPTDPFDFEQVASWLSGADFDALLLPPTVVASDMLARDQRAIADELGFSIGSLDGMAVLSIGVPALWELLGPVNVAESAEQLEGGVKSIGPGADGQLNFGATSELRPMGIPLRLADIETGVAMSQSTEAIKARLAVEPGSNPGWAPEFEAVGEAAMASDPFVLLLRGGVIATDLERAVSDREVGDLLETFDPRAIAIALTDSDGLMIELHYDFGSAESAAVAVPSTQEILEAGASLYGAEQLAWSATTTVESVSVNGSVVSARLRPDDANAFRALWVRVSRPDLPFATP